jgi:Na+-transporting methylmalonyl-CoA/oxaloacetate decarboxylase gamma subunit
MGFSLDHISFANLFANGNNYIVFSIMGMLIVFAGLSFISIYITLLLKLLKLPEKLKSEHHKKKVVKSAPEEGISGVKESELLLAIAVALHLEQTNFSSDEKITWKRDEDRESPWLTAGRMSGLAVRSHLPDRRS